jgi:hypothetical protein
MLTHRALAVLLDAGSFGVASEGAGGVVLIPSMKGPRIVLFKRTQVLYILYFIMGQRQEEL